jgi:hypothetical protein
MTKLRVFYPNNYEMTVHKLKMHDTTILLTQTNQYMYKHLIIQIIIQIF